MPGSRKSFRRLPTVLSILAPILLVVYASIIAVNILSGEGLPSYANGVFNSATIAYYIAWAKEVDAYGWFTPAWCGGFDLFRFYPPIGLGLIYVLGRILQSFEYGAYIAYYIALALFAYAAYRYARVFTGPAGEPC
ncbi:hypothetical protein ACSU1N_04015 [Thermogladius sp. 4427co]|uniref:hypothetical protein n=1 Tax=Thermogladius sp. 4427co TaxID=3450718 RepID=UPI003F799F79